MEDSKARAMQLFIEDRKALGAPEPEDWEDEWDELTLAQQSKYGAQAS